MGPIKPIRTEADYDAALARVDALMDATAGSPEGEELDVLADLVEHYESKHIPMGYPTPIAAIEYCMEQRALTARDLVPFLGSRAKVSEVLSGKRPITMPMARALHEHLGIPAEVLLRERGVASSEPIAEMEWTRFPFKAMAKLGWIRKAPDSPGKAEKIIRDLIHRAGVSPLTCVALYRKNDHARANAKTDPYALKAWCWQVLATGNQIRARTIYRPGTVTPGFLRSIAMLSEPEDGPRRAKDFLAEHGVAMVTVRHLPKTHLDGAVLRLADGAPVIGLTLRYDRLDNFWFCLLHELSHLGRHMDTGNGDAFIDDLTLRGAEGDTRDPREAQADEWAEEALIPRAIWEASTARLTPTPMAVVNLARTLRVHPAIVAGRIRHEQRNYRMLSHFVGTHEVRRQLGTA